MEIRRVITGSLGTNSFIFESRNALRIIDPADDFQNISGIISAFKKPVKSIILTHYHFDHSACAPELKARTGGEILIHKADREYLEFEADRYLRDGEIIDFDNYSLRVIHTPGHTRGSICLLGEKEIFTGDTLFKDGYGRTDLPGGSDADMQASLIKLKKIIKPGMAVYPGHGEAFKNFKIKH